MERGPRAALARHQLGDLTRELLGVGLRLGLGVRGRGRGGGSGRVRVRG